jgi:hypothetical protein
MSRRRSRARTTRRRRLPLFVAGLLALAGVATGLVFWLRPATPAVAVDADAPGRLIASQPTVDLGRVPFDVMKEARFELANTGGSEVRLTGRPQVKMLEGC